VNFTPPNALYWQPLLQVGMLLEITDAAKSEMVAVTAVGVGTFTANFTQSYSLGSTIVCRGNPGPQTTYNPHADPGVVLHMSVIK
jgi:hypothetical protein